MMVKKSHYCSSVLFHKVKLEVLGGFQLYPSKKTLLAASLIIWMNVSPFIL